MSTAPTERTRKRGLIAALSALVLVALALVAAGLVWALDRPRGLQVNPSSINFGDAGVGRQSAAETVRITNHGGQAGIDSIRITGKDAGDFTITDASTCTTGPFEEGNSCTIVVRFTPTEPGDRAAMLGVLGISGGPAVSLSGTGAKR
jgi:hypothetical protein